MSRSLITYYSMNGTTARVAESIANGLRVRGHQVDLHNLKDGSPPPFAGYDLLGVGLPVYFYQPPVNVLDYVKSLPNLAGLPAFSFLLYGSYIGEAGNIIRRALARKGAREVGYFHCRGDDIFLGYLRLGYLFSPDRPTTEELSQAEAFGNGVADVTSGQPYTRPPDDPHNFTRQLQAGMLGPWMVKHFHSRLFSVDRKKCTACGLCTKQCPTRNITADNDGRPVWGNTCIMCVHCEMNCPQEAITSSFDQAFSKFSLAHNVKVAANDPEIEHVRVELKKGRLRRL
ncbi:MAG: EFR1 family ferrodoxin [Anaerolineae bacterium]|nr:EFR1 family ferrodoxin [Anaerolineae bacterium]